MKKGFTLMEVLAVILILAMIGAFAAPAFRSIRADITHRRAIHAQELLRDALLQMKAQTGVDILLNQTDGYLGAHYTRLNPSDTGTIYATVCQDLGATGIPLSRRSAQARLSVANLFACGYLNPKDFKGLPYSFAILHGGYCSENGIEGPDSLCLEMKGESGAGKYTGTSKPIEVPGYGYVDPE